MVDCGDVPALRNRNDAHGHGHSGTRDRSATGDEANAVDEPVRAATQHGTARVEIVEQDERGAVQEDIRERAATDRVDSRDRNDTERRDTGVGGNDRTGRGERSKPDRIRDDRNPVLVRRA
jgi:hypothetical protein